MYILIWIYIYFSRLESYVLIMTAKLIPTSNVTVNYSTYSSVAVNCNCVIHVFILFSKNDKKISNLKELTKYSKILVNYYNIKTLTCTGTNQTRHNHNYFII